MSVCHCEMMTPSISQLSYSILIVQLHGIVSQVESPPLDQLSKLHLSVISGVVGGPHLFQWMCIVSVRCIGSVTES